MNIDLSKLNYKFFSKPLLVGGKAKEFYGIRKSGDDTDMIISEKDYSALSDLYPKQIKDIWGDLGVSIYNFEIWKTIRGISYDFLSEGAIEKGDYKIISLPKLLFLTALAMGIKKYHDDLELIVKKINTEGIN